MKFGLATVATLIGSSAAFAPAAWQQPSTRTSSSSLAAEIRGPTKKSEELRFGWDGTTALGGAVEVAKPARMLEDIRAAGETIPEECEVRTNERTMEAEIE
eukprot:scaffold8953_cov171-Amphora_coffeaeformis.AAC.2